MSNFYCAAPWRGLHINLDGDIRLCCAGEPGSFGNVKTDSLDCITQSLYLQQIRSSIKQGQLHPEYCSACIEHIGRGEREWFNEAHGDIDYETIPVDRAHEFQSIDLRWNNTCNLACTYCGPYFSSTWSKIRSHQTNQPPSRRFDDIVDQIVDHGSLVKTMMLVGGEPLLIPHNERLLTIADHDTTVVLITNLAVPLGSNRVFGALKPLAKVNWNVSLENIGQRFEFVRRGADWTLLSKNLDILQALFPRHAVGISAMYHVFNCSRLREFLAYMHGRNINVNWNIVSQNYLDPRFHNESLRQIALNEIDAVLSDQSLTLSSSETDFFNIMAAQLTQDQHAHAIQSQFNDHIAQDRNQFRELWPELVGALS